MTSENDLEFKEGLRQYIILCGKSHGKVLTEAENEKMFELFMKYELAEEARVQRGAKPTFSDEEHDALFKEGEAMQDE